MTTISGLTPVSGTDINFTGAITPDAMMMYCASKLRGLDDQMQTQFDRQKQYRDATAAVNDLATLFNDAGNTAKGMDGRDPKQGVDPHTYEMQVNAAFDRALASLPADCPERQQVLDAQAKFKAGFNDGVGQNPDDTGWQYVFTAGQCKELGGSLEKVSKDLSSSAELDMINLNSLMSQRQTAVQMCTNMVSALGETQKAIAAKIGS
jgi:hypothetical protein